MAPWYQDSHSHGTPDGEEDSGGDGRPDAAELNIVRDKPPEPRSRFQPEITGAAAASTELRGCRRIPGVTMATHHCSKCALRAKYDRSPTSIIGRLWKWHIRFCPGWKRYKASLSDDERAELEGKYALPGC